MHIYISITSYMRSNSLKKNSANYKMLESNQVFPNVTIRINIASLSDFQKNVPHENKFC